VLADRVFEWLSQQPAWQQDLARRLLGQPALEDMEYAEALRLVKGVHGVPLAGPVPSARPPSREGMTRGSSSDVVQLLSIGRMRGVGLVSEEATLKFGDGGLTIVYGGNGTGKSSYVKALKKISRTVDLDCAIRPSVYTAAGDATPSAEIRVSVFGELREQRTSLLGDDVVRLPGMSVFDSACAELYVDGQNVVQYVPTELRLLSRLAATQDRMRAELSSEHGRLARTRPVMDHYPEATEAGRILRSLEGSDADSDLAALSDLTEVDHRQRDRLRAAIAAAAASTSTADAAAATRDADEARALVARLAELANRVAPPEVALLRAAAAAHSESRKAAELAAEQLQGPVDGVGGGPWRLMWEAARSFVAAPGAPFPPPRGSHCPLCLQVVDEVTAERLLHLDKHIKSTVSAWIHRCGRAVWHVVDRGCPAG